MKVNISTKIFDH